MQIESDKGMLSEYEQTEETFEIDSLLFFIVLLRFAE
jgi:hypothetical protein